MEASLTERLLRGDERALARTISRIESGSAAGREALASLRPRTGRAAVIGVTGSPGSGKSTLVDQLIGVARERGERVAVVAVDPTSPYSGGAILGDRIRMGRWHQDREVFIRSMATRGHLGGLAAATLQVVALLDAVGFDRVFVETVGVGQSEVDIVEVADTTVLVLPPGQGDAVQAFKAGVMEVADVFALNKFDQPGGPRLKREIRAALELGSFPEGAWRPPLVETIAAQGEGAEELMAALDDHRAHLEARGELVASRRRRARFEIAAILHGALRRSLEGRDDAFVEAVLAGRLEPEAAARELLEGLGEREAAGREG